MMKKLIARLKAIPSACEAAGKQAVRDTLLAAEAEAKSLAPVRTGRLKGSILSKSDGLSGMVYTNCDYAPSIELGGRGNPARPFLLPAAQLQAQAFPARAAENLENALKGGK